MEDHLLLHFPDFSSQGVTVVALRAELRCIARKGGGGARHPRSCSPRGLRAPTNACSASSDDTGRSLRSSGGTAASRTRWKSIYATTRE